jgi:chitodextrinase
MVKLKIYTVTFGDVADTQAPTVPSGLSSSNIEETSFTLSWNASTDNVGVTGYDVYQNGSYIVTTANTSYNISGLTASTTYSYYVKAKDAAGNVSVASSTINVTTDDPEDVEAPTAPTNLVYSNLTETTVDLSWTASTDNVGVVGYDVYQDGVLINNVVNTNYSVTGLSPETTYEFYVKAKDAIGLESFASNTITVTTDVIPDYYCNSQGNNSSYEWISKVEIDSYSNASGAAGYSDFTNENIALEAGTTVDITLTPGFSGSTYNEYWKIWIDYNNDADFDDSGELVFDAGSLSKNAVSGTISIPSSASGTTVMRVSMKYNAEQTACESFTYGEVEDYTVTFGDAIPDTEAPTTPTNLTTSVDLTLTITFDNYPEETSWNLKNSAGSTVASGGTYGSQADGSTLVIPINGLANDCYDFTILDSYGDGICCSYGNGSYTLEVTGGGVLASGGQFTSSDVTNFCLPTASSYALPLNVDEGNGMSTVNIYPNPANAFINVDVINGRRIGRINIYNTVGTLVKTVEMNGNEKEIDISELPTGLYIISIEDEKEPLVKQFIKQ